MNSLYLPLYLIMTLCVLLMLVTCGFLYQQGWSVLALLTWCYIIIWPLAALWYWVYLKIKQPLQQVLSYCQSLNEKTANVLPEPQKLPIAYQALLTQICQYKNSPETPAHTLLLTQVAEQLPFPMLIFNQQQYLLFANKAAANTLKVPLLTGNSASQLGFTAHNALQHPLFKNGWQQHSISSQLSQQPCIIFYALDLRHPLYQQQKHSQQQLIRVLSHELRNSLTPMASMAETLLQNTALPETETRQVLQRIQQRSQKLLVFIDNYARLSQLPAAQLQWFTLESLLHEVKLLSHIPFEFTGEKHGYGDPVLLSQLLLNLLKNAFESIQQKGVEPQIRLRFFYQEHEQVLEIEDNGIGFSNPDNLFVPFYTTKPEGSGIGLQLCKDIMQQHQGDMTAVNHRQGASIRIHWPLPV